MTGLALGVVSAFDPRIGLGVVDLDDGRQLEFHATAIADGSRMVAVGTAVAVTVSAAHRGRDEVSFLRPS